MKFKLQTAGVVILPLLVFGCSSETSEDASTDSIAEAAVETAAHAVFDAAAFYETTSYRIAGGGNAFSADGTHILITSDQSGVFNAYALPLGGGEPVALTASDSSATIAISYYPDDGRMLFTADQDGNELNHLYLRGEDGSVVDLTPGENLKASFSGWLGDGSAFFVATNERDARAFDLYRYDAASNERQLVFENTDALGLGSVSNDGRWLSLTKPRNSADSDVFLVDLSGDGVVQLVTGHEGNIAFGAAGFSADSAKLLYSTNEHGEFRQIWTHDLTTGEKAALVEADWDVQFAGYSKSGRYFISAVNEDATTVVTIDDLETGLPLALPPMPAGNLASVRFNDAEDTIAFTVSASQSPANIYTLGLAEGNLAKLTDALNPAISEADLVASEVIRYASFDGLEIPSILYKPLNASADNKVPALVWVHGGPGGQTRTGYNATIQHLVNHGYAILGANNRGSSGYGKTFNHMDDKRHGEVDLQDIVYGRTYLESLDWVDGERIGIIGGSYGGYMVAAALAFEPEVFDVGVDIFGVTNWVRTLTSIPPWWEAFKESLYDEMGDPATDLERHTAISPLFHAANIIRPTLVIQGANDPRVLQVESDELVAAIEANGVPVTYIVFPDEGHGFRRKANRITASEAYLKFLDQYLKGDGTTETDAASGN